MQQLFGTGILLAARRRTTALPRLEVMGQVLELFPLNAYTTPFSILEHLPARVCLPYGVDDLDCSSAPSARAFWSAKYYRTLSAPGPVIRRFSSRTKIPCTRAPERLTPIT